MNADVSRTLARFISSLNLDREVARDLAAEFADAQDVADLPDWVREVDDPESPDSAADPTLDEIHAMAAEDDVERAAGHDVTPGHDELHHYWLTEGLPKWADSPRPWTTLVALLTRHVGLRKAKIFASRWFIEHFGFAAGSDQNRVVHGQPPRGHRIGPG